jgi:hypothetical protein
VGLVRVGRPGPVHVLQASGAEVAVVGEMEAAALDRGLEGLAAQQVGLGLAVCGHRFDAGEVEVGHGGQLRRVHARMAHEQVQLEEVLLSGMISPGVARRAGEAGIIATAGPEDLGHPAPDPEDVGRAAPARSRIEINGRLGLRRAQSSRGRPLRKWRAEPALPARDERPTGASALRAARLDTSRLCRRIMLQGNLKHG